MANKKLTRFEEEEKKRKALAREQNKSTQQKKQEEQIAAQKDAKKKEEAQKKKQTGFGSNPFSTTLRVLDTPRNAIMSAMQNDDKKEGFMRGLTRKDVVSGRDLIDPDKKGGVGSSIKGFGMDMALDPMTFAGNKIFNQLGKGVKYGAKQSNKALNFVAPKTGAKLNKFGANIKKIVDSTAEKRALSKGTDIDNTIKTQIGEAFIMSMNKLKGKHQRQSRKFLNFGGFDTMDQSVEDMLLGKVADPANKGKVFKNSKKDVQRLRDTLLGNAMDNTADIQINMQDFADRFMADAFANLHKKGKNKGMAISTLNNDELDFAVQGFNDYLHKAFATGNEGVALPKDMIYVKRNADGKAVSMKLNDQIKWGKHDHKQLQQIWGKLQSEGKMSNLHEVIPQWKVAAGTGTTPREHHQLRQALGHALKDKSQLEAFDIANKRMAMDLNLEKRRLASSIKGFGTETADMFANIVAREGRIPSINDLKRRNLGDILELKKADGSYLIGSQFKEAAQRKQEVAKYLDNIEKVDPKGIERYMSRKFKLDAQQASSITDILTQNQNISKLYGKTRGSGSEMTYLNAVEAQRRGYNTNVNPFESVKAFGSSVLQNVGDEKVLGNLLKNGKQSYFHPTTKNVRKGYQTIDLTKFEAFNAKTPEFQRRFIKDMGGTEGQTLFSIRDSHADYARAIAGGGKIKEGGAIINPMNSKLVGLSGKSVPEFMTSDIAKQIRGGMRTINSFVRKFMIMTPGYHMRNQVGQRMNIKAAGVKGVGDEYWTSLKPFIPGQKGAHDLNKWNDYFANIDKNPTSMAPIKFDDLDYYRQQNVLRRRDAILKPAMQQDSKGIMRLADANMHKTIQTDHSARMALAETLKAQGHANPYGRASEIIFSRGNFGKGNEDMLRELFLFSGYTLKNANFHMRNIQQNPQFYARTAGLVRNAQQNLAPSGEVPTFSEESGRVPIPLGENTALQFSLDMPAYSAGRTLLNPFTGITQSLAPQYKSVIELGTGNSTFTGLPIENKPRAVLENFGGRNPLVLADTAYTTAIGSNRLEAMSAEQKNLTTLGGFIQPNASRRDLRDPVNLLNLPGLPVTVLRNKPLLTPEEEEELRLRQLRGY